MNNDDMALISQQLIDTTARRPLLIVATKGTIARGSIGFGVSDTLFTYMVAVFNRGKLLDVWPVDSVHAAAFAVDHMDQREDPADTIGLANDSVETVMAYTRTLPWFGRHEKRKVAAEMLSDHDIVRDAWRLGVPGSIGYPRNLVWSGACKQPRVAELTDQDECDSWMDAVTYIAIVGNSREEAARSLCDCAPTAPLLNKSRLGQLDLSGHLRMWRESNERSQHRRLFRTIEQLCPKGFGKHEQGELDGVVKPAPKAYRAGTSYNEVIREAAHGTWQFVSSELNVPPLQVEPVPDYMPEPSSDDED